MVHLKKINIAFFGTPEYSLPTLKALYNSDQFNIAAVITQKDKKLGRGQKVRLSAIKKYAKDNNIRIIQPSSIKKNTESFLNTLEGSGEIDLAIVIAYGQILPKEVLNFPKIDCINLHASLLPRWRGAAPIQRAIMAGDSKTGVCIMKMEEGLDTGPVYCKEEIKIEDNDNFETLHNKLSSLSAEILLEKLPDIISAKITATEQDKSGITYAKKITKEDEKINWNNKAVDIQQQISALSPFPGAYALLNNKRIKLFKSEIIDTSSKKEPGELTINKDSLYIYCNPGLLKINELQLESKKKMKTSDFLKGNPIIENSTFN
ncbi:UNVERIFIED_CONTAM: hypothetical protein GTU68_025287 [Idotea baltica]|nr:hypothetical protein [Idotea baltica]